MNKHIRLLTIISMALLLSMYIQSSTYATEINSSNTTAIESLFTAVLEDIKASHISIENISEWFNMNKEGIQDFVKGIFEWIETNIFPTEATPLPIE